jgi:O-antigen ligase
MWFGTDAAKLAAFLVLTPTMVITSFIHATGTGGKRLTLRPIDAAILCFAVWAAVGALRAPYKWAAVVPAVTLLSLLGIFYALRVTPFSLGAMRRRYVVIAATGVLIALLGMATLFHPSAPTSNPLLQAFAGDRIRSTLGNPNLLGSFLNVCFFASAALLFSSHSTRGRVLLGTATAALILTGIFLTKSRGAAVGFVAGVVVFVVLCLVGRVPGKAKLRWGLIALLVLSLAMSAALVLVRSRTAAGHLEIVDAPRRFLWRNTLTMIADAPVAGHGLGQYETLFPLYRRPPFPFGRKDIIADRAHSEPLELTAELGIVGLAVGIAVVAFYTWTIVSAVRTGACPRRLPFAVASLAGATGVIIQGLVCINTRAIQCSHPAVLIAALGLAAAWPCGKESRWSRTLLIGEASRRLRITAVVVGVLATAAIGLGAARHLASESQFMNGTSLVEYAGKTRNLHRMRQAEECFISAVRLNPWRADARFMLGQCLAAEGRDMDAIRAFREVERLSPNYSRTYEMLAVAYERLGLTSEAERWRELDEKYNGP